MVWYPMVFYYIEQILKLFRKLRGAGLAMVMIENSATTTGKIYGMLFQKYLMWIGPLAM